MGALLDVHCSKPKDRVSPKFTWHAYKNWTRLLMENNGASWDRKMYMVWPMKIQGHTLTSCVGENQGYLY